MLPRRLQGLPSRTLEDGLVVHEAASLRARLLGLALLPRGAVPREHALLIPDCRSVHTFGMRFPIDVVFLDERGRALRVERGVKRRRVLVCRAAFAVLERPSAEAPASADGAPGPPAGPPPDAPSPRRRRGVRGGASEP